ncbi:MAG: DEAD/DEAH box helicase, partial [Deltaproteobacteria bacterium]|nr:DEAD/DEAH box helicase [Deltaproteobacteria bacterium]
CMQITEDLKKYAKFMKDINIVAIYGGASIFNQISQIRRGARIIVATPGRLLDLMKRKVVKLSEVTHVILDEADEMLNMGFW